MCFNRKNMSALMRHLVLKRCCRIEKIVHVARALFHLGTAMPQGVRFAGHQSEGFER